MKMTTSEIKVMEICERNIQGVEIETDRKETEQESDFIYLENITLEMKRDTDINLQRYSKINDIIKRNFGTQMPTDIKLHLHNIISRATLNYGKRNSDFKPKESQK
jgi:hypothetical protein